MEKNDNPLNIAIIGCGNRCRMYQGAFAAADDMVVTALCDTDIARAEKHRVESFPKARVAADVRAVLDDHEIDAVVVATPDSTHCAIAGAALDAGKHVLVEKPLSLQAGEARELLAISQKSGCVLQPAFTLRATPFYHAIHALVREGAIGRVMGIEAAEHVGRDHGASYMRRWQRHTKLSGGLLMNKCCHDIDLLRWIAAAPARRVASFGGRDFFNPGSHTAAHCSNCAEAESCRFRYNGTGISLTDDMRANPTKFDLDLCVFTSDKDLVDNQVVILEYANNVRASFTVQMFSDRSDRTIHVSGTEGFLRGVFSQNKVEVYKDGEGIREYDVTKTSVGTHGGGDVFLVRNFADSIRGQAAPLADCAAGVENTLTCLAAETARREGSVVELSPVAQ